VRRVRLRRLGSRHWALIGAVILAAVLPLVVPSEASSEPTVTVTPVVRGTIGANGWYASNVTVNWTFSPLPDRTVGCDALTITADGTTQLDCQAWWGTIHIDYPLAVKVDKTPPTVRGVPSRPADANGWYNHALTVSFSGTDSTSGIAGCTSAAYSGPDNAKAVVSGSCTDKAGNVGRASFSFAYDATPPTLSKVTFVHRNHAIDVRWTASADARLAEVKRSSTRKGAASATVYRGAAKTFRDKHLRAGARYRYIVTVFDAASNSAIKVVSTTATGALLSPLPGARVGAPPRLVWTPVKGASYYNVQLIQGRRILSAWPTRPQLRLPRTWIYQGQRYRLRAGRYRWYVWPGYGLLSAAHYGRLLGGSSFVVAR